MTKKIRKTALACLGFMLIVTPTFAETIEITRATFPLSTKPRLIQDYTIGDWRIYSTRSEKRRFVFDNCVLTQSHKINFTITLNEDAYSSLAFMTPQLKVSEGEAYSVGISLNHGLYTLHNATAYRVGNTNGLAIPLLSASEDMFYKLQKAQSISFQLGNKSFETNFTNIKSLLNELTVCQYKSFDKAYAIANARDPVSNRPVNKEIASKVVDFSYRINELPQFLGFESFWKDQINAPFNENYYIGWSRGNVKVFYGFLETSRDDKDFALFAAHATNKCIEKYMSSLDPTISLDRQEISLEGKYTSSQEKTKLPDGSVSERLSFGCKGEKPYHFIRTFYPIKGTESMFTTISASESQESNQAVEKMIFDAIVKSMR